MTRQRTTYLLAILYAFIIGFSFLFTKLALQFADPIDTLAYRFTISFIGLGLPVLTGWIRLDWQGRKWQRLIPLGLVYPTAFMGFQAFGLAQTPSSEASIYSATSPVFTLMLASLILKEKSTWMQKLSVLSSVGGVLFILWMDGASLHAANTKGMVFLLISSLMLALYGVLARFFRHAFTTMQMSFIMMLFGCLSMDAYVITRHAWKGTMNQLIEPMMHANFIYAILYIGLLSSLLSSLLSNYILSKLEASQMSMFANVGSLISMVAGVLFLHEHLAYYHVIGAILIISGVVGVNYRIRRTPVNRKVVVAK